MANNKISDGVGKKIVEALKKQSEIEVNPFQKEQPEVEEIAETSLDDLMGEADESQELFSKEDFLNNLPSDDDLETLAGPEETIVEDIFAEEIPVQPTVNMFTNYQQPMPTPQENFVKDLDTFEIPSNIAVLKKLIAQLPSGVTRHTGAQIIRQTMEALGISMKSVLQEAQQVQDGLSNSVKECHTTIQDYKRQIMLLEKQAQNQQKQYAALNELISLFIQTGM